MLSEVSVALYFMTSVHGKNREALNTTENFTNVDSEFGLGVGKTTWFDHQICRCN